MRSGTKVMRVLPGGKAYSWGGPYRELFWVWSIPQVGRAILRCFLLWFRSRLGAFWRRYLSSSLVDQVVVDLLATARIVFQFWLWRRLRLLDTGDFPCNDNRMMMDGWIDCDKVFANCPWLVIDRIRCYQMSVCCLTMRRVEWIWDLDSSVSPDKGDREMLR